MSELPRDLCFEILSRLEVGCLVRFRCVSRAWRRFIDDPIFSKLHLHRQFNAGQLILYSNIGMKHCTLSLDSLNCYPTGMVVVETSRRGHESRKPTLPVPSCNGLILIPNDIDNVLALWNPSTRETHVLPSYTSTVLSSQQEGCSSIAFCYDSVTDDYKVVKIVVYYNQTTHECRCRTLVYSLKSNSWRKVKDCPHDVPTDRGVFVNGALHWSSDDELMIIAFDLATEDYYMLPLPSELSKLQEHSTLPILDALDECLLVTWEGSVYRLDDYGGKNSWTKLFSLSDMGMGNARLIAYSKTKEEVLLWAKKTHECFWFDIENLFLKKVRIAGSQDYWYFQICQRSIFRLRNSDGVDGNKLQMEVQEEEDES